MISTIDTINFSDDHFKLDDSANTCIIEDRRQANKRQWFIERKIVTEQKTFTL